MRIEEGTFLDFSDVLMRPKRSTIESRKDIQLTRTFKFLHSPRSWSGIPILSANMSSVTNLKVAEVMKAHEMLSCFPKGYQVPQDEFFIESVGLKDKPLSSDPFWLCLDVPNAHIQLVVDRTKELRNLYPETILIVGNVASGSMVEELLLSGADVVKCGIGGGSACSTRVKTRCGVPQLSAVIECSDAAHGLGGQIISDGGCQVSGDLAVAFGAGADFVMLGGMLAGHHAYNGADFYGMSSERANNEMAGGLKDYRAAEGWEMKLPDKGRLEDTLQDILGGLRSACSYVGATNLKNLPKCASFVRVNNQVNQSLWNYRI